MTVFAFPYEEDLPALQSLPKPIRWTVRLKANPKAKPLTGTVDTIGAVIDPNMRTALVTGQVDNTQGLLLAGEFVTATVETPPPRDQVVIPTECPGRGRRREHRLRPARSPETSLCVATGCRRAPRRKVRVCALQADGGGPAPRSATARTGRMRGHLGCAPDAGRLTGSPGGGQEITTSRGSLSAACGKAMIPRRSSPLGIIA